MLRRILPCFLVTMRPLPPFHTNAVHLGMTSRRKKYLSSHHTVGANTKSHVQVRLAPAGACLAQPSPRLLS